LVAGTLLDEENITNNKVSGTFWKVNSQFIATLKLANYSIKNLIVQYLMIDLSHWIGWECRRSCSESDLHSWISHHSHKIHSRSGIETAKSNKHVRHLGPVSTWIICHNIQPFEDISLSSRKTINNIGMWFEFGRELMFEAMN
jgi:hypothetical protein